MGRADRISGFFWLLFSLVASIESYRLGLGTLHEPGPGFLFFWTGIAMAIMSIAVIIRAWGLLKAGEPRSSIFQKDNLLKIVFILFALFLYAFFMEILGFILITLLLFIFLLGVVEKKRWYFTLIISVAVTVIAYLLFETWLQSQLPKGLLGF